MVKGKTHLHCGWRSDRVEPDVWQHYLGDHKPYNKEEKESFKKYISNEGA